MHRLKQWLKSLVKVSKVSSIDDSGRFRFGNIFYQGKTAKSNIFTPYGFYHNPPVGSIAVSWSQLGQSSNNLSMAIGCRS
jgi:hypothetical protein